MTMKDREPIQLFSNGEVTEVIETSLSLGDPTMHDVLTWHRSICLTCKLGEKINPPVFGAVDSRNCREYYEIVSEYSEYEQTYIKWGNP